MKRPIFYFLVSLFVFVSAPAAQAQFVGFVGLQTTQQTALNAVSTAQTSATLRNVGQTAHFLSYTAINCSDVRLFLEGSWDGTTFVRISTIGTDPNSGLIFASGYYPAVRANLEALTCVAGSLTARYSGTNATPGPPTGLSTQSLADIFTREVADIRGSLATLRIAPPNGHTGGVLYADINPSSCTGNLGILVNAITNIPNASGVMTVRLASASFPASSALGLNGIGVPSVAAEQITIGLDGSVVAGAGACALRVAFASDRVSSFRSSLSDFLGSRTAVGVFVIVPDVYSFRPSEHTVHLTTTGGPATCTFSLEGSLDRTTWFDLSGAIACTSSTMFHVVNKPVNFVRGNLTALAGGASPAVAFHYIGKE